MCNHVQISVLELVKHDSGQQGLVVRHELADFDDFLEGLQVRVSCFVARLGQIHKGEGVQGLLGRSVYQFHLNQTHVIFNRAKTHFFPLFSRFT